MIKKSSKKYYVVKTGRARYLGEWDLKVPLYKAMLFTGKKQAEKEASDESSLESIKWKVKSLVISHVWEVED